MGSHPALGVPPSTRGKFLGRHLHREASVGYRLWGTLTPAPQFHN